MKTPKKHSLPFGRATLAVMLAITLLLLSLTQCKSPSFDNTETTSDTMQRETTKNPIANHETKEQTETEAEIISEPIKEPCECLEFTMNYDGESYSVIGIGTCTETDLVIPNTYNGKPVTNIGHNAFGNPYQGFLSPRQSIDLTSVTIPNSVTSIEDYAFAYCTGLTELTIPDSVTSIGDSAFEGCTGLTSVTIGNGVMSIGKQAFKFCSCLTNITIPNGVTEICEEAFSDTAYYDNGYNWKEHVLYIGNHLIKAKSAISGDYVIRNETRSIADYAFCDRTDLMSVTIPDSVTSIGDSAFEGCTGLTELTIPDSVTSIGDRCFCDCDGLTSITIPDNVTSIGEYAFGSCSGLKSITIGTGVTSMGYDAFALYFGKPTSVTIHDLSAWCQISFANTHANPLRDTHHLYLDGKLITDLEIPAGVKRIGDYAFCGCTDLTSITIPDSVTSIGDWPFAGCTNVRWIDYTGTISQWKKIEKVKEWNYEIRNCIIYCIDGELE